MESQEHAWSQVEKTGSDLASSGCCCVLNFPGTDSQDDCLPDKEI